MVTGYGYVDKMMRSQHTNWNYFPTACCHTYNKCCVQIVYYRQFWNKTILINLSLIELNQILTFN